MEIESLFTDVKWDILKLLSERGYSPIEISAKINTTISNVSQQLRLLEAAGLVNKKKISNRDKGKPRTAFYLSDDYAYILLIMNNFTDKKLMRLDDNSKFLLKILFLEDKELHYYIQNFYWKIEENLSKINLIGIDVKEKKIGVLIVSNESKELKKNFTSLTIRKSKDNFRVFDFLIYTEEEFIKQSSSLISKFYFLYDPTKMIWRLKINEKEVKKSET